MNIACALKCGIASVGIFSTGRGSPYKGKTFHMLDIRRWATLIWGRKGEESRIVAL